MLKFNELGEFTSITLNEPPRVETPKDVVGVLKQIHEIISNCLEKELPFTYFFRDNPLCSYAIGEGRDLWWTKFCYCEDCPVEAFRPEKNLLSDASCLSYKFGHQSLFKLIEKHGKSDRKSVV